MTKHWSFVMSDYGDVFSQDNLFGQWISEGWVKTFWTPSTHRLQFIVVDGSAVNGYRVVYEMTSSIAISFEDAQSELKFFRKNNNPITVIRRNSHTMERDDIT